MNDDLILALYPKAALAKDAKVAMGLPSPAEFSIGHIVKSKQEVDALMQQAEKAGAHITDPAHDRFWGGYSGYFLDLDGHLWEIAWNPHGKSRNRDIQPSGPLHGRRSIGRFCEASFDLLIASALYLVGTVLVTIVFNVPKNEALASVARAHPDGASLWAGYVASWTAWNHVRTAASLAAAASFSIALGY